MMFRFRRTRITCAFPATKSFRAVATRPASNVNLVTSGYCAIASLQAEPPASGLVRALLVSRRGYGRAGNHFGKLARLTPGDKPEDTAAFGAFVGQHLVPVSDRGDADRAG